MKSQFFTPLTQYHPPPTTLAPSSLPLVAQSQPEVKFLEPNVSSRQQAGRSFVNYQSFPFQSSSSSDRLRFPEDPEKKCGFCGIKRSMHHLTFHGFSEAQYKEKFCPLCRMFIEDFDDNFDRHYRNCVSDKPYE